MKKEKREDEQRLYLVAVGKSDSLLYATKGEKRNLSSNLIREKKGDTGGINPREEYFAALCTKLMFKGGGGGEGLLFC